MTDDTRRLLSICERAIAFTRAVAAGEYRFRFDDPVILGVLQRLKEEAQKALDGDGE